MMYVYTAAERFKYLFEASGGQEVDIPQQLKARNNPLKQQVASSILQWLKDLNISKHPVAKNCTIYRNKDYLSNKYV